jgi:hypothetical protein
LSYAFHITAALTELKKASDFSPLARWFVLLGGVFYMTSMPCFFLSQPVINLFRG